MIASGSVSVKLWSPEFSGCGNKWRNQPWRSSMWLCDIGSRCWSLSRGGTRIVSMKWGWLTEGPPRGGISVAHSQEIEIRERVERPGLDGSQLVACEVPDSKEVAQRTQATALPRRDSAIVPRSLEHACQRLRSGDRLLALGKGRRALLGARTHNSVTLRGYTIVEGFFLASLHITLVRT